MLARPRQRQRVVLSAVAVLGMLLGAYLIRDSTFDANLQGLVYDYAISAAPAQLKNQITIVAVDDATIAKYGRYPLPRRAYADALNGLARAKPTVIGFDVAFYDRSDSAEDDRLLATAVRDAGNVVLAMQGAGEGERRGREVSFPLAQLPLADLRAAAADVAAVNVFPDIDGRVRDAAVAIRVPEASVYSLPVVLAARHYRVDPATIRSEGDRVVIPARVGAKVLHLTPAGTMPIYFAAPPATRPGIALGREPCAIAGEFCVVSMADLVAGRIPERLVTGRTVLIGFHSVSAIPDDYPVPNSSESKMFGVEIWANATQTIFTDRYPLRHQSDAVTAASVLLFVVGGILLVARQRLVGFLGALGLLVAYAFVSIAVFVARNSGEAGSGAVEVPSIGYVVPSVFWWVVALGYLLVEEQLSVRRTQATFGRFVTPSVARTIMDREEAGQLGLGGEERTVTVLFGDIRGFTSMSEGMQPGALLDTLNRYFEGIVGVVNRFDGTVNKYNGDNIMVIWNAPLPTLDHERKAVRCALEIQRWVVAERAKGGPEVSFGFGINTGPVVAGFLGALGRMEYTVIGDTANVASRLTSSDIARRDQVVVSDATLAALGDDLARLDLGAVRVKGRAEPVRCWQIDRLGDLASPNPAPPPERPLTVATVAGFH